MLKSSKSQKLHVQIFINLARILVIFVFGLKAWNLFCVNFTSLTLRSHIDYNFVIFFIGQKCPLNWAAGQGDCPVSADHSSPTTFGGVLWLTQWVPHPIIRLLQPPPTRLEPLTFCLTFRPVDPTLNQLGTLSQFCLRIEISKVLICCLWLIESAYLI